MRGNSKGGGAREDQPERGLVRRGGVLCESEQRSTDDVGLSPGQEAVGVSIQFLIAFVRAMIRNNPSEDLYTLSMMTAEAEIPITDEQKSAFLRAILHEAKNGPEGFF